MLFGYARVSTQQQSVDRQIDALLSYGISPKNIFQEKITGTKANLDMRTPTGMLLITVLSAISQFEREIIVQRTEEGLAVARSRGRSGGRPRKDPRTIDKAIKLYNAKTHSIKEICEITGISQGTLYNSLNNRK